MLYFVSSSRLLTSPPAPPTDGYRAAVVATLLDLNATRSAQEARCEVGRVDPKSGNWTYAASVWPAPCPDAADAPGAVEAVFLQA